LRRREGEEEGEEDTTDLGRLQFEGWSFKLRRKFKFEMQDEMLPELEGEGMKKERKEGGGEERTCAEVRLRPLLDSRIPTWRSGQEKE
jgi:hypothetical protein